MTIKSCLARTVLPLALSMAVVTEASAWGGWGWDSGSARQQSRESHHAHGGWHARRDAASPSIGGTAGGSSVGGNGPVVGSTAGGAGALGADGAGGGAATIAGAGGAGAVGGAGGAGGAAGTATAGLSKLLPGTLTGTGGLNPGTGPTAGVTNVGAPEIDGQAGLAALALLLSAMLLAFRRVSRV